MPWLSAVCVMVVMWLGAPTATAQSTNVNPESCTYSFVVPQTDILTTCQRFSSQQVDALQKKIDQLEDRVRLMSTAGGKSSSSRSHTFNSTFGILNPRFTCTCRNKTTFSFAFRDCQDVKTTTDGVNGVYKISPIKETSRLIAVEDDGKDTDTRYWVAKTWPQIAVFCEVGTDIGWTVIMRRRAFDVDFNRTWDEYKDGFGNMTEKGDFWLGLNKIHRITSQKYASYGLWMVVTTEMGVPHISPYSKFEVASEEYGFKLSVSGWHGGRSSTDYFTRANNRFFVAWDRDGNTTAWRAQDSTPASTYSRYYREPRSCTRQTEGGLTAGGGWWFYDFYGRYYYSSSTNKECGDINLNAEKPYMSSHPIIKSVEMKIRPMD